MPPFQGFTQIAPIQGFGRFAAFALGFAVPRFQRWRNLVSLTRMPFRAPVLFAPNPGFRPLRGLHPGLCCSAFRGPAPSALEPIPVVAGVGTLLHRAALFFVFAPGNFVVKCRSSPLSESLFVRASA